MNTQELIGKTVTNIYGILHYENYGLDTGEIFIELNHHLIIAMPAAQHTALYEKELTPDATALINNITDEMIPPVNPTSPSTPHTTAVTTSWLYTFLQKLFHPKTAAQNNPVTAPVVSLEKQPRYIKNRKIIDFIWYPNEWYQSGYLQLDNGCIIGETTVAPNGTGLVGLNYYYDLKSLALRKGLDYETLTSSTMQMPEAE